MDLGYTRGYLNSVDGYASLAYQRGGMLHQVTHANAVVETLNVDPIHPFDRPYRITTSGVTTGDWDSGVHEYDGSGNVKKIGEQLYKYDKMSRLVDGQVEVDGVLKSQAMTYDAFGNILNITTDSVARPTQVTAATNRLTNATYDAGGNLTDINLEGEHYIYTYDPLNMMKQLQSTTDQARGFIYDADDERVMTFDCALVECTTQTSHLTTTIRGLDGKVLRVYNQDFAQPWDWVRDYVYRDGLLLASVEPDDSTGEATSHLHLDHLGTPRQITDDDAVEVAWHTYYPFGEEATDPQQDQEAMKFTGHERDENGSAQEGMLDYMHARYCSPALGRFMSPDKVPTPRETLGLPNRWNRYTYAANNPLTYVDPTGNYVALYIDSGEETDFLDLFKSILRNSGAVLEASQLGLADVDGELRLTSKTDFSGSTNPVAQLLGSAIKTSTRISFAMLSEGLGEQGGGLTDTTMFPNIDISVNPNVIRRLRVRGTTLSGAASGFERSPMIDDNLLVPVSLEAAVVHEFGHAFGTFGKGLVPNVGTSTTPWAFKYENHYRRLAGEGTARSLQGEKGVLLNN